MKLVVSIDPAFTSTAEGDAQVRLLLERNLARLVDISVRRIKVKSQFEAQNAFQSL